MGNGLPDEAGAVAEALSFTEPGTISTGGQLGHKLKSWFTAQPPHPFPWRKEEGSLGLEESMTVQSLRPFQTRRFLIPNPMTAPTFGRSARSHPISGSCGGRKTERWR